MHLCDLTLDSPEEDLACDEALLDWCEAGAGREVLRFWEPARYFVVAGYANKVASEVNIDFCRQHGIPILRRLSGGGTVLQGPGCLNYSLVLRYDESGPCQSIASTNQFILERQRTALRPLLQAAIEIRGHTDLAIAGLKFSGNSQRRARRSLLFHGCFLLHFDVALIQQALPMPSRQPDYRGNRPHTEFLMNLEVPVGALKAALRAAWKAATPLSAFPAERIGELVREKYGTREWNSKF